MFYVSAIVWFDIVAHQHDCRMEDVVLEAVLEVDNDDVDGAVACKQKDFDQGKDTVFFHQINHDPSGMKNDELELILSPEHPLF